MISNRCTLRSAALLLTGAAFVAGALAGCSGSQDAKGNIVGKEVTYSGGGVSMKGYLAYDAKRSGKGPGILVVHEWWGHNDYARKRADMLAQLGYTALAVDMYGDGKQAAHPGDAGKFAGAVMKNFPTARERFEAAAALLRTQPTVDPSKLAAIGYCFGGGVVLNMARAGADLKGVVSFHGSLGPVTKAKPGGIKAKLLVLNGAADPFVKPEQITAFKKEMKAAGADLKFIDYPGAQHAFTNPAATENGKKFKIPLAYDAQADKQSWAEMQAFFSRIF